VPCALQEMKPRLPDRGFSFCAADTTKYRQSIGAADDELKPAERVLGLRVSPLFSEFLVVRDNVQRPVGVSMYPQESKRRGFSLWRRGCEEHEEQFPSALSIGLFPTVWLPVSRRVTASNPGRS
jgi:hypothetical protein